MKIGCCFIFLIFDFFSCKEHQDTTFYKQILSQQLLNTTESFYIEGGNHPLSNFSQERDHLIINGFKTHNK